MKKRIGYFLLVFIAIFGSRLLYGINYDLNTDNQVSEHLYRYNIIGNRDFLAMQLDGNYLYYVTSDHLNNGSGKNLEYNFVKYDLEDNKVIYENHFVYEDMLYPIKIIKKNNDWYLVSLYNNSFYQFNRKLELVQEHHGETEFNSLYGIYNNKQFNVSNNQIIYDDKVYDEIPNSCGYNQDIIYSDNTYIRFYNYNKDIGCLYNLNNKSIYYLDYDNIDVISSRYLEYQNNSLKFRYDNNFYYLNDITENYNLKMHKNGDYVLTYDSTNYYLRIYNLDTQKIIYEKKVLEFKNSVIENIKIDNYAYFTLNDGENSYIYLWDYLKEYRLNKNMLLQNEKEYKFENNKLVDEIKEKYNINIYLYDQAVKYLNHAYVLPSYDEILIHTRLLSLKNILETNNYYADKELNLYMVNELYMENSTNNLNLYKTIIQNKEVFFISLIDNNYENTILNIINKEIPN